MLSLRQETFVLASSALRTMYQNPLLCLDTLYHISNTHTHTHTQAPMHPLITSHLSWS